MMKYLEDMQKYNNSMLQQDTKKKTTEDGAIPVEELDVEIINEFSILNPD